MLRKLQISVTDTRLHYMVYSFCGGSVMSLRICGVSLLRFEFVFRVAALEWSTPRCIECNVNLETSFWPVG